MYHHAAATMSGSWPAMTKGRIAKPTGTSTAQSTAVSASIVPQTSRAGLAPEARR